ncbi:class I SAM-dependent methyltransferase [Dongshaea marina]|uniref:class I SAM-dependent methyltransferase n=1 Tax=Dongshaea marina TaxID=2047966 RepID=UPI000D3E4748|nr:class I SAM-dependent methyltransferase [Dongshaea marina]
MNDLDLLVKLHVTQERQGPGGPEETRLAARLTGLSQTEPLMIADIGCGTGASTLELARHFNGSILAVDFLPEFIEELKARASKQEVGDKIHTSVGNMEALVFDEGAFDLIWSEGAVYNIGFEKGIREWRKYLKPGGRLVVSELSWLTAERPDEITQHWEREYPQVAMPSQKIAQLEAHGYRLLGYFPLSQDCWMERYYQPLKARFESFTLDNPDRADAVKSIVEENLLEIDLYERFKEFVSYGFYIAEKL